MKSLKEVRNKLGLTQQDLAAFLEITRSQLAMAESGKRSLSTDTLIKLATVEKCIEEKTMTETDKTAVMQAETQECIALQIKRCQYELAVLTKKTDAAEARFKKAERLHYVIEFLAQHDMGTKNEWVEYKRLSTSVSLYHARQHNIDASRKKINELTETEKALQQCLQNYVFHYQH